MNESYTADEMGNAPLPPDQEPHIEWPARIVAVLIILAIGICIYKKLFP